MTTPLPTGASVQYRRTRDVTDNGTGVEDNQTMTDNTNKLRAVFLTALMIGSVFAAGIAFTGSAAAATNTTVQASNNTAGASDVRYNASANVELNSTQTLQYVTVTIESADVSNVVGDNVSVFIEGTEYTDGYSDFQASGSTIDFTLSNSRNVNDGDNVTVIVDNVVNPTTSGVYTTTVDLQTTTEGQTFEEFSGNVDIGAGSAAENVVVEGGPVEFNAPSNDSNYVEVVTNKTSQGDFTGATESDIVVYNRSGSEVADASDIDPKLTDNGRIVVNLTDTDLNGEGTLHLFGENYTITTTSATVEDGQSTNGTAYVGSNAAIVDFDNPGGEVTVYEDGERLRTRGLGDRSFVRVFDTDGLSTDSDYTFQFGDEAAANYEGLNLLNLGLTAELASDSVETNETVEVTAETDDVNQDLEAYILNSDGERVGTADSGQTNANGVVELKPVAPDTEGNYTVVVEHIDSGVTVEKNLTVADITGEVSLADSVTEQRGDIVEIPVSLQGVSEASITVGTDDVNYVANVTVTDAGEDGAAGDGEVVLQWNTYTAGHSDDAFSVVNDDGEADSVSVDSQTSLTQRLADGNYDVFATSGGNNYEEAAQDLSTVYLEKRSTGDQTIYTAPGRLAAEDVLSSGDLTESSDISFGKHTDYSVHQIDVSGIYGLLANQSGEDATTKLGNALDNESLGLSIEQTDATTGPNQNAATVDIDNSLGSGLWATTDAENNTVYLVLDADQADFDRGDIEDPSIEATDTFNATFSVTTDSGLVTGDSNETASAEFTLVEESTTLDYDGDHVTVENAGGQQITGTSTLAPGTEFSVRVQSTQTPGQGFILSDQSVVVQDDGSFAADLNFSGTAANSTFNVNVRLGGDSVASATGEVVELTAPETTAPETTALETTAPETTAPETTAPETTAPETTAPATTEETTSGETGGGIPGFGMGIALIAVLGAALLALRQN